MAVPAGQGHDQEAAGSAPPASQELAPGLPDGLFKIIRGLDGDLGGVVAPPAGDPGHPGQPGAITLLTCANERAGQPADAVAAARLKIQPRSVGDRSLSATRSCGRGRRRPLLVHGPAHVLILLSSCLHSRWPQPAGQPQWPARIPALPPAAAPPLPDHGDRILPAPWPGPPGRSCHPVLIPVLPSSYLSSFRWDGGGKPVIFPVCVRARALWTLCSFCHRSTVIWPSCCHPHGGTVAIHSYSFTSLRWNGGNSLDYLVQSAATPRIMNPVYLAWFWSPRNTTPGSILSCAWKFFRDSARFLSLIHAQ